MDDILENIDDNESEELPQQFKTLSIISHIGNAIWGLLMLITLMALMSAGNELLDEMFKGQRYDPELKKYLMIILLVMLGLIILSVVGVVQMKKRKKSGFILYAVTNGIWALLLLVGTTTLGIIGGLASIGFILALVVIFIFNQIYISNFYKFASKMLSFSII